MNAVTSRPEIRGTEIRPSHSPTGARSAFLGLANQPPWFAVRVNPFLYRHTLPDVKPVLIAPHHQVAARAESQLLKWWSFHSTIDKLHFNAAFWASMVPVCGINGRKHGIAIFPWHGTNLLAVIRPDSPSLVIVHTPGQRSDHVQMR